MVSKLEQQRGKTLRVRRGLVGLLSAVAASGAVLTAGVANAAPTPAAEPQNPTLTVTETSRGLNGLPSSLHAGRYNVRFSSSAPSPNGIFFQFIKLTAGYSKSQMLSDLQATFNGNSTKQQRTRLYDNAVFAGGSGQSGDNYNSPLQPGHYVVGDFINGRTQDLTVTAGNVPAPSPSTYGATINAYTQKDGNFNFGISGPVSHLRAIRFTNSTPEPHFISFAKLNNGATAQECVFQNKGCTPGYTSGTISSGQDEIIDGDVLHLTPGRYAIACFIPDEDTGMPHAFMGMYRTITVT